MNEILSQKNRLFMLNHFIQEFIDVVKDGLSLKLFKVKIKKFQFNCFLSVICQL